MRGQHLLVASALVFAACSEEGAVLDGGPRDSGSGDSIVEEGPVDVGFVDAATDAAVDAGLDAAADAGDSGPDAAADAGADAGDTGDAGSVDAAACVDKADCQPAGWCRETAEGGMACTPWAAEGEFCGGFTAPWGVSRCNANTGATCNTVVFIPDAPGVCSYAATVDMLIATPATFDGHVVALSNVFPVAGPTTCTPAMPCNTANPCSVSLSIGDTVGATNLVTLLEVPGLGPVICAGNECDYLDHCPQPVGMGAIVVGVFRAASLSIEVQFFNAGF